MKTHIYVVQKGDNVKPTFVGSKIEVQNSQTVAEALAAGHFESEAAIVAAANAIRNIAVNRVVRKELAKENGSVAEAVKLGNAVKVGTPRAASTPKTAKPSTIRRNTAAASGNRLFEKCSTDADFLRRMVSQGIVDQGEYDTWLANKDKKDEKKAPATTPADVAAGGALNVPKAPTPAKAAGSRK
jgi:hypothetical protein